MMVKLFGQKFLLAKLLCMSMILASQLVANADTFTTLLVHSDTYLGDTSFVDSSDSNHALSSYGNVSHSTSDFKFGTSSIYFDGSHSYISVPNSIDWEFGVGDFTIDFWVKPLASQNNQVFFTIPTQGSIYSVAIQHYQSTVYVYDGSTYHVTGVAAIYDAWQHYAYVRSGDTITIYRNGSSIYSFTKTNPINGTAVNIGNTDSAGSVKGYIDEFRISKGIARWTVDFTPPTSPYDWCDADYDGDNDIDLDDLSKAKEDLDDLQSQIEDLLSQQREIQDWIDSCWVNKMVCN